MNIEKQYLNLLQDILDHGSNKKDRTGTGTLSVFGRQIRHHMREGFPLLTTKKMAWRGIVQELIWFLKGDTNIKYLVDNGVHIWDGDAYKNYLKLEQESLERWLSLNPDIITKSSPLTKEQFIERIKTDEEFAKNYGELGPIYGKQWREWQANECLVEHENKDGTLSGTFTEKNIDQINGILELLKKDPDSRRILVNAWNPGEIDQMALPPCHYSFQLYTRELKLTERLALAYKKMMLENPVKFTPMEYATEASIEHLNIPNRGISLMWNQRSVDSFLGLPFNIASYALLLSIIGKEVNMEPDELIGNLGDTHIYTNHIDQVKEQLKRDPYECPKLDIKLHFENVPSFVPQYWMVNNFEIKDYKFHPAIKAPLSN